MRTKKYSSKFIFLSCTLSALGYFIGNQLLASTNEQIFMPKAINAYDFDCIDNFDEQIDDDILIGEDILHASDDIVAMVDVYSNHTEQQETTNIDHSASGHNQTKTTKLNPMQPQKRKIQLKKAPSNASHTSYDRISSLQKQSAQIASKQQQNSISILTHILIDIIEHDDEFHAYIQQFPELTEQAYQQLLISWSDAHPQYKQQARDIFAIIMNK